MKEKQANCIFCGLTHESHECDAARNLTLNERKDVVKRENACFYCLKRGHIAKKCRVRIKCEWCSRRHSLLMCPTVSSKEGTSANEKVEIRENNLASMCGSPAVRLQTLRMRLFSNTSERIARVVLDSGSERSYIRSDLAKELGYKRIGK